MASPSSRTSSTSWADLTYHERASDQSDLGVYPPPTPGCRRLPFCLFRLAIYRPPPSAASSTRVGAAISRLAFSPILQTLLSITRWQIRISTIAAYPGHGETRALNFNGQMLVMGGGRTAPNPSNEVDVYDPGTNSGQQVLHSPLRGATSPPTPTARPHLAGRRLRCTGVPVVRWRSSARRGLHLAQLRQQQ